MNINVEVVFVGKISFAVCDRSIVTRTARACPKSPVRALVAEIEPPNSQVRIIRHPAVRATVIRERIGESMIHQSG